MTWRFVWLLLISLSFTYTDNRKVVFEGSRDVTWGRCRDMGGAFPRLSVFNDLREVGDVMKKRNLSSVWTGLRRQRLTKWTWINNVTDSLEGATFSTNCALLNATSGVTQPADCASRDHGHLCQQVGCRDCSRFGSLANVCRKIGTSCFIYHCDGHSWDGARASCLSEGQILADTAVKEAGTSLLAGSYNCQGFWVGLRKEYWKDNTTTVPRSVSRWGRGEPAESGDCAIIVHEGGAFIWRATKCTEKHHAICTHYKVIRSTSYRSDLTTTVSETTEPDRDSKVLGTALGVSLGVVMPVVVVVIFVLYKRGRLPMIEKCSREQKRRKQGDEEITFEETIPLADNVENNDSSTSPSKELSDDELDRVRKELAEYLLYSHKQIELWTFLDEEVKMDFDEIFTEMTWSRQDRSIDPICPAVQHYTAIFKPDKDGQMPRRVLVHGEAGTGKTTLVKKILLDWSRVTLGRIDQNTDCGKELGELWQKFQYVIPIFLRDIRKNETLEQAVRKQVNPLIKDLWSAISKDWKQTLLILEGYDEFWEDECKEIVEIVKGYRYPGVNIIITCRAPYSCHLHGDRGKADLKIDLLGFSQESVETYVKKFFRKKPGAEAKISGLLEKISPKVKIPGHKTTSQATPEEEKDNKLNETHRSSDADIERCLQKEEENDLSQMSRIPAILLLMCVLWEKKEELSDTVTGFYKDFVRYMCARYGKKYSILDVDLNTENIYNTFMKELLDIGKFALNGLKKQKLNLTFSIKQVRKEIRENVAFRLGFFVKDYKSTDTQYVRFHHRTIQEFFTAFYIVQSKDKEALDVLTTFCSSQERLQEARMIITFVAGLGGENMREYVVKTIRGWKTESVKERVDFLLTWMDENKEASVSLPPVIDIEITPAHQASTYTRFFKMPAEKVTNLTLNCSQLKGINYIRFLKASNLRELHVYRVMLPSLGFEGYGDMPDELHSLLPSFSQLKQFTINNFQAGTESEGLYRLLKNIDEVTKLRSMQCRSCLLSLETVAHIAGAVTSLPKFQELVLAECGCSSSETWKTFSEKLKGQVNIQVLNLSGNNAKQDCVKSMATLVESLSKLKELRMFDNQDEHPEPQNEFLSSIARLPALGILDVGRDSLHQQSLEYFGKNLSRFKALEELYLVSCGCDDGNTWNKFINCLPSARKVKVLDFSDNKIGKESVITIAGVLPKLRKLHTLELNGCEIVNSELVLNLIQSVSECPSLKKLGLSENGLGDDIVRVTKMTDKLTKLEQLSFKDNEFSRETSEKLERMILKTCPDLKIEVTHIR